MKISYAGRFSNLVNNLLRNGIRVVLFRVSDTNKCKCNRCNLIFDPPDVHLVYKDCFSFCPGCDVAIVVEKISNYIPPTDELKMLKENQYTVVFSQINQEKGTET